MGKGLLPSDMPSSSFCVPRTVPVCHLRPVRTLGDVEVFQRTGTHQLGADPRKVLKRLTAQGRMAYIVEGGQGVDVGVASLTETEVGIGVVGVALLEEYRNRGYGSAIIYKLEAVAAELGFIALRADVFDDNEGGVALFTSKGFRRYSLFEKPI